MALPKVTIPLTNGALGIGIPTDDALSGLILQGPAPSGLTLLTPTLITSLTDAEALGITAAYDTTNSVNVYKAIKDFYTEAQTGLRLWIMITSQTVLMASIVDKTEANYAVKLLNAAQGKIRMLGVVRSPDGGYTPDIDDHAIELDVVNAMTNAQALAVAYEALFKPVQIVLEARSYTGTVGDLVDLTEYTNNRVALMLGDIESGAGAAVGLFLGRCASIPVQRNVGRVKDGALAINTVFIGTDAFADAEGDVESIHDKGFITFRRFQGKAGFYFSNDPTATARTDDYGRWARVRIINKAIVLTYLTFVEEILDEVAVDSDGRIETVKAKYYQSIIESQINTSMTSNGEIDSVRAFVDPEQDVISTSKVCVQLRLTPVGYADEIEIELGFEK